jgi:putative FmdB family regulatory protein
MPTYEYECPRCPRVFEVKQRITEPALVTCEVCGGPIHRLLSAAPFILKGEGWYVTDYPSESRKKAKESASTSTESAGKESAGKESASKGDGGSAESKPATSSETKSSTDGSSGSSSSSTKPAAGTTKPSTGTTKPAAGKPAAGS